MSSFDSAYLLELARKRSSESRSELAAIVSDLFDGEGMVLTVAPDNKRALKLYQSVGFTTQSLVPHFYGKGHDRHILRWCFKMGGLHSSV